MTAALVVVLVLLNAVAVAAVVLHRLPDFDDLVAQHEHRRQLRRLARARRRARRHITGRTA